MVVIWCPELLQEGAKGEEARRFALVLERAGELCPWVHPVRLGVGVLPALGFARFFGGEEAVAACLGGGVGEEATIGVADGLFAAMLAARSGLIVPSGGTADFLGPWSVATLARPDLAVTLQRLGVTTLASWPRCRRRASRTASARHAAACHAVARGESGELAGLRGPRHCSGGCGWPGARIPTGAPTSRPRPPSPASSAAPRRPTTGPPAPSSGCRSAWGWRPW